MVNAPSDAAKRWFEEVWNKRRVDAIDGLSEEGAIARPTLLAVNGYDSNVRETQLGRAQ